MNNSNAFKEAPIIGEQSEFEKIKVLHVCLKKSIIAFLPVTYPPPPPPIAFPRVDQIKCQSFGIHPQYSTHPLPVFPMTPIE